jgi:regulator of protease activity HflC (stomatin/prohibitin superfamily)
MLGGAICGGKATGFEALNTEIEMELTREFKKSGIQLTFFGLKQPDLGAYGKKLDEIRLESKNVEVSAQKALKALEDKKVTETNAEAEANAAKTKAIRKAEADKDSAILAAQGEGTARTTKADAEKNATITLAEGNADATKKLAEATAEANTKIAKSLTPELAYYNLQMELFKRWSGQVPQIQITQPVSGTNGIVPVIALPAK